MNALTEMRRLLKDNSPITLILFWVCIVLSSCASLPKNVDREMTFAMEDTSDTRLARLYQKFKSDDPEKSGFLLLTDGFDAFAARLILAKAAEKSIDAQYYMIHGDLTGGLFADQLIKAADRGVRVRLLIDDMDLEGRDEGLSTMALHPQISVRIFNPFNRGRSRLSQFVTRLGDVTRRMHNKSFTVDNLVTVVGGRNIGNEYFNADPDLAFGDLDLLAVGPVVKDVSNSFDLYWNNSRAYPVETLRPDLAGKGSMDKGRKRLADFLDSTTAQEYLDALLTSNLADRIRGGGITYDWGMANVVADHPDKIKSYETTQKFSLAKQINPYFEEIERELLIFSPYFVPGRKGTRFLLNLRKRGVTVRIITNSLASTDVGLVHAGYAKYRKTLLRGGVELYEVNKKLTAQKRDKKNTKFGSSKSSLHAKSFILDRSKVFIGSLNLDPRSVTENTEIGIVLNSEPVAERMVEIFNAVVSNATFRLELTTDHKGLEYIYWHGYDKGEKRVWTYDPHTSFLRRFGIGLMGFLPIESQI